MIQAAFVKVAEVGDLSPGEMMAVEVGDDEVLLANVEGAFYACAGLCTHALASLADGDLDGNRVECPAHGAVFDVTTGEVVDDPADENLQRFEVRFDGEDILVGPAA